jgi:hypothetical protein
LPEITYILAQNSDKNYILHYDRQATTAGLEKFPVLPCPGASGYEFFSAVHKRFPFFLFFIYFRHIFLFFPQL